MSGLYIYDVVYYAFLCFTKSGKRTGEYFTMVLNGLEYHVRVDYVFKTPVKNEKMINANMVICHKDVVFDHTIYEGAPCLHIKHFDTSIYSVNYKGGSFSFPLNTILAQI